MFSKKFSVNPNNLGYLFRKNQLEQKLEAGIYRIFDWSGDYQLLTIPTTTNLASIGNQEVLTKDHIALRFSYVVEYTISEPDRFLEKFDVLQEYFSPLTQAYNIVHNYCQVYIRKAISTLAAEELNDRKAELLNEVPEQLVTELAAYGISINHQMLKDVTFPKSIQNLFAKKLEAKIRTQADLENARSAVATARALKNASKLMEGDGNIRFIQLMETMTKIAAKGNHTFVMSDAVEKVSK